MTNSTFVYHFIIWISNNLNVWNMYVLWRAVEKGQFLWLNNENICLCPEYNF